MKMRNNVLSVILLIIIILCFGIIGHYNGKINDISKVDTITITRFDTVYNTIIKTVEKPILKTKEVIKRDTIYQSKDTTITLPVEKIIYNDTIICEEADSVIVESTIVGINPSLESIKAKLIRQRINQTNEIIITKKTPKKGFYVAPNASIGFGIFSKQLDTYIGIGIGYRF